MLLLTNMAGSTNAMDKVHVFWSTNEYQMVLLNTEKRKKEETVGKLKPYLQVSSRGTLRHPPHGLHIA